MTKNKIKVECDDKVLYVVRPNRKVYQEAQAVSNRTFRTTLDGGTILRSELDQYMEDRGLWDKVKQEKLKKISKELDDNLLKLKRGGISLKDARSVAIDVRRLRVERTLLISERNQLDEFSVESQAENERFDFLVSECTLDEEGNKVFKDLDDYKERSNEDYAFKCASALGTMLYGLDENWQNELPENKFLTKYNLVNDKLQLVNERGDLVDGEGNLINENLQRINSDGKPIDEDGNLIDEDGLLQVDSQPFLDENGNPI